MYLRASKFFEGVVEGAANAGASLGEAAITGASAGLIFSLAGAFAAYATGNNVFAVAQKCAYVSFLSVGSLMSLWNGYNLLTDINEQRIKPNGLRPFCRVPFQAVAVGEVATFGIAGWMSAPTVESMVRTIVK